MATSEHDTAAGARASPAPHTESTLLRAQIRRYQEQLRRLELVSALAAEANGSDDPEALLANTLRRICEGTGWPVGHAWRVANGKLHSSGLWHPANAAEHLAELVEASAASPLAPGEDTPGVVWQEGEPLWASNRRARHPRARLARALGLRSSFCFPVLARREVAAVLEFFSREDLAPDELMLDIVAPAGALLGQVFERHAARRERARLTGELLELSRRAGMAEVAAGVLHNVGNALNSIVVSLAVLERWAEDEQGERLRRVVELIAGQPELEAFLSEHPRGRRLTGYLQALAAEADHRRAALHAELARLAEQVRHIEHIVHSQQRLAMRPHHAETVSAPELVAEAARIAGLDPRALDVQDETGGRPLELDRHALLEILANLLLNARQAVAGRAAPRIAVRLREQAEPPGLHLEVEDDGCGIRAEDLPRVFDFGFTTKRDGHGIGLHTTAMLVRALGGRIEAASDGPGRGARFSLTIPCRQGGGTGETP